MKKTLFTFLILSFFIISHAQENDEKKEKTDEIKTGWNFGLLPAISFDSDLGFQYGGLVNFYDYGDGSRYPNYNHSIYIEASAFTKGSGIFRVMYDTDKLIKGIQITTDLSYLPDQAYRFYGYNGYDAVYKDSWVTNDDEEYRTRMFYNLDRKFFRFKTDWQGKLYGDNLKWVTGLSLYNVAISKVDIDRLNEGNEDNLLPSHTEQPGLFEKYQDWGIISPEEADGGFIPIIKLGMVYDSRDNRPNPMKGIWTELVLVNSPEFLGAEMGFTKLSFIHRQYFTLIPKDLSFAYRLSYQGTIAGKTPFYAQPLIETSILRGAYSEGLGGGKTLRGIIRNRVIGDGFVYGNFEFRWKFARFRLFNQNFYLGLNAFADVGQVVQKVDLDLSNVSLGAGEELTDYFLDDAEKMHLGVGAGLRIAMNQNFIIAVDYGKAIEEQDGNSGMYIGLNYLF